MDYVKEFVSFRPPRVKLIMSHTHASCIPTDKDGTAPHGSSAEEIMMRVTAFERLASLVSRNSDPALLAQEESLVTDDSGHVRQMASRSK